MKEEGHTEVGGQDGHTEMEVRSVEAPRRKYEKKPSSAGGWSLRVKCTLSITPFLHPPSICSQPGSRPCLDCPCTFRPLKESLSCLLLPKSLCQCVCRKATVSFACLRKKAAWVSLLGKGARLVLLCAGKMVPRYFLSICPYFLFYFVRRAHFQGSANPHDCKGCTSTKTKDILLLQSLRYRREIEGSSQRCYWERGGRVAGGYQETVPVPLADHVWAGCSDVSCIFSLAVTRHLHWG